MTSAAEVIALQIELADRLDNNGALARCLDAVLHRARIMEASTGAAQGVSLGLRQARAYRVQENMTPAIMARAGRLDDATVAGRRENPDVLTVAPPRPCGFVVLEEPIRFPEIRMLEQCVHAITWTPMRDQFGADGWFCAMWNDIDREADAVLTGGYATHPDGGGGDRWSVEAHRGLFGRWAPIGGRWLPVGETFGPMFIDPSQEQRREARAAGAQLNECNPNPSRYIAALWQLLDETIPAAERGTDVEPEHTPRATQRRARNAGHSDVGVSTVVLRREAKPVQHPGSGRPLDHRVWVEGGFTRTYWVGPLGNRRPVKRTIGGYWMGSEDLPVRDRRVVSELRR